MNTTPHHSEPARQMRSEGLLPAGDPDPSLEVAEEVAFDQQSDQSRKVGAAPPDVPNAKPAEAMAEALGNDQLKQAVERAIPKSP